MKNERIAPDSAVLLVTPFLLSGLLISYPSCLRYDSNCLPSKAGPQTQHLYTGVLFQTQLLQRLPWSPYRELSRWQETSEYCKDLQRTTLYFIQLPLPTGIVKTGEKAGKLHGDNSRPCRSYSTRRPKEPRSPRQASQPPSRTLKCSPLPTRQSSNLSTKKGSICYGFSRLPSRCQTPSCLKDEDDDVGLLVHFVKGLHAEITDSVKKDWVVVLLRGS